MAWLQRQPLVDGRVSFHLTVKNPLFGRRGEPRTKTRALGVISEERAKAEAEISGVVEEGRKPKTEAVEAAAALEKFLAHWRLVRRRSEKTITFYEKKLRPLFEFMGSRSPIARWHAGLVSDYFVSRAAREKSKDGPARRGIRDATIKKVIVAAGTFVKWARKAKLSVPDFVADVDRPTVRRVEKKAYEPGDVAALKREIEDLETLPWLRLAVWLAYDAGFSLGDIRKVDCAEVDWRERVFRRPRSKTGYPIEVPITPKLFKILKKMRPTHGPIVRGIPDDDSTATQAFRRLCTRAGVDPVGGFKRLRHTYATELGRMGFDQVTIGELLGHAPGSVQARVYTHTNLARKRAAIAALAAAGRKPKKPAPAVPPAEVRPKRARRTA